MTRRPTRRDFLLGVGGVGAGLATTGTVRREQVAVTTEIKLVADGGDPHFEPVGVFVEPDETVSFVIESGRHSTTAYENRIPEGATAWDSGVQGSTARVGSLVSGGSLAVQQASDDEQRIFTRRFAVEGTYDFYCRTHPDRGMVGRIVCGSPGGPAEGSMPPDGSVPSSDRIVRDRYVSHAEFEGGLPLPLLVGGGAAGLGATYLGYRWRTGDDGDDPEPSDRRRESIARSPPEESNAQRSGGDATTETDTGTDANSRDVAGGSGDRPGRTRSPARDDNGTSAESGSATQPPEDADADTGPPGRIPRGPEADLSYADVEKDRKIGSGGSADVYEARAATPEGEVTVALKEPRVGGGETLHRDAIDEFLAEADTWSRLDDHEGVVGVVDYGDEPLPWVALEYMAGGELGDRAGLLGDRQAAWTALAIVRGVRHAHEYGVAHLDIKPQNVLFRSVEGAWDAPKVSDWGLATALLDRSETVEGLSPTYAAPEQFDDDYGSPGKHTDVYQLGAVCYELFTGQVPFPGDATEAMYGVLEGDLKPATSVDPSLPDALDDVLATALARDPQERYESVLYMRDDLRELYESL